MKFLIEVNVVGERIGVRVLAAKVEKARAVKTALAFLRGELKSGPKMNGDLFSNAESAHISKTSLYRAGKILGVIKYPVGYRACDGWTWELRKEHTQHFNCGCPEEIKVVPANEQTNMAHDASGDEGDLEPQKSTLDRASPWNGLGRWKESGGRHYR